MTFFCTIYYLFSYIEIVPQIFKLLKTKSSEDYSLTMLAFQLIALVSWTIYIFTSNQNIIVYIGTVIDLILLLLIDALIILFYDNRFANKINLD